MKTKFLPIAALIVSGLVLNGCATVSQEDLAEVRALANQASTDAAAAKTMAADALSKADAANATAIEAKMKSEETETKIDRMFKKSMYK